jgi:ribosomal protein L11 methyltransferase
MRTKQNLWLVNIAVPSSVGEAFADAMGEDAVATSVHAPPRVKDALIELIYDHAPDAAQVAAKLDILASVFGIPAPAFTIRPAPPLDWLKKVAEDFPPLKIARWTVHGALHRDKVPVRLNALQIDATNAFGTGEHPTTRGCLLMLDKILKRGFCPRRVADIGCGSGILAMACVQASRGLAVGVEMDADSVQIAKGNARANGLQHHIQYAHGKGYAPPVIRRHAPYDLVLANIFARPLSQLAKDLRRHLRPGGIAILSGLLTSQANLVIAAHRMQGLSLVENKKIGEWSVLAFRR